MKSIRLVPPKRTITVDTPLQAAWTTAMDMLIGCVAVLTPWALAVIAIYLKTH